MNNITSVFHVQGREGGSIVPFLIKIKSIRNCCFLCINEAPKSGWLQLS